MPMTACESAGLAKALWSAAAMRPLSTAKSCGMAAALHKKKLSKCIVIEPRPVLAIVIHGGEKVIDIDRWEAAAPALRDRVSLQCRGAIVRERVDGWISVWSTGFSRRLL